MQEEGLRKSREQERETVERREARRARIQERIEQVEKEADEVRDQLEGEERSEGRREGRGRKRIRLESCMEGENRSWRVEESSGEEWELSKGVRQSIRRRKALGSKDEDPSDEDEGIPARIPHNILKITTPLAVYEGISIRTHLMLLSLFCIASGNQNAAIRKHIVFSLILFSVVL